VRGFTGLVTFVAVALAAAVVAVSASAAGSAARLNCQKGTVSTLGGCLVDAWPTDPSNYSAIVAKAAFTHDYNTIWKYLNPTLQGAVSQKHWTACQKHNPLSSPNVKIKSIRVADSRPLPATVPPFGPVRLRMVTLQVLFTSPSAGGEQAAEEYAYWLNSKGKWTAVWLPATFDLYKSGKCDTGELRGLY
jgi:hypothetical protein